MFIPSPSLTPGSPDPFTVPIVSPSPECHGVGIIRRVAYSEWLLPLGNKHLKFLGVYMHTLLSLQWMTNRDLLWSPGNSAQCEVGAWRGAGGRMDTCIRIASPFAIHLKLSPHGALAISQYKIKIKVFLKNKFFHVFSWAC